MKKIIIAIFYLAFTIAASAQVKQVTIQASGLTCSMCSNAINKALRTLPFVENVQPDIKTSSFKITVKPGSTADFDKLKAKVEGAGFFVAKFTAVVRFDNIAVQNDAHVNTNAGMLHFVNSTAQTLDGDKTITLLDKGFLPAKDYKKNSGFTKMECYKTGQHDGKRIYHVSI
jgi:copper chaperone CopZ